MLKIVTLRIGGEHKSRLKKNCIKAFIDFLIVGTISTLARRTFSVTLSYQFSCRRIGYCSRDIDNQPLYKKIMYFELGKIG